MSKGPFLRESTNARHEDTWVPRRERRRRDAINVTRTGTASQKPSTFKRR